MAADDDPLFLQVKEARASVLEPYAGKSLHANHGQRVVAGQRLMQSASDVFLGWTRGKNGKDFYLRQLRDMKFAPDPATFNESTLVGYATMCGRTLARAHARSGDAVAIAAYLGTSAKFDKATRDFALAYSEQVTVDFAAYQAAITAGTVTLDDPTQEANYAFVVDPVEGVRLVDAASPPAPSTVADAPPPASS
jgi:hypothetical protein